MAMFILASMQASKPDPRIIEVNGLLHTRRVKEIQNEYEKEREGAIQARGK